MPDAEGEWAFDTSRNARSLAGSPARSSARALPPSVTDRCACTTRSTSGTPTARGTCRSARPRMRGPTKQTSSRSRRCARSPSRRSPSCGCASSPSRITTTPTSPSAIRSRARSTTGVGLRPGRTRRSGATWSGASPSSRDLGIEADLILFHAYDRWGFSDMGRAADDRYVRYRRRAACRVRRRVVVAGQRVRPAMVQGRGPTGTDFAGSIAENDPYRSPALHPQRAARSSTYSSPG